MPLQETGGPATVDPLFMCCSPSADPMSAATQRSTDERTADESPSPPLSGARPQREPSERSDPKFDRRTEEREGHLYQLSPSRGKQLCACASRKLENSGLSVWIDQWDIAEGDDWDIAIDAALYTFPGFLIVMSPASVESPAVRGELRAALSAKKHIFPVLYQKCPRPPRDLLNIQWTDLTAKGIEDETAIQSLVRRIKTKLSQNVQ